jgi:deferrochelatase/peroxidase EfeB
VFSDSEKTWRHTMALARRHYEAPGLTLLETQDFGAQPGDLNPLGYRDSIGQPAIEGSGVEPLPGQGRPIKAGELILGYPGEGGAPLPMPGPDALGRNGTFVGPRKYQSRVGAFNRFLRANAETDEERELLAAKLFGRWRSGAPLTLAPTQDDPALGADPSRNNDFTYAGDPDSRQVPLGSHMRRMNPRDTKLAVLTDVNVHRIIRRSTTFGAPYDPDAVTEQDDEVARGLYFIFMSAKAMATLEFLQREWVNDGNFVRLGDEAIRTSGCRRTARRSRFRGSRSGAASTASRRSTYCAAASTSSCRRCRGCDGSRSSRSSLELGARADVCA